MLRKLLLLFTRLLLQLLLLMMMVVMPLTLTVVWILQRTDFKLRPGFEGLPPTLAIFAITFRIQYHRHPKGT